MYFPLKKCSVSISLECILNCINKGSLDSLKFDPTEYGKVESNLFKCYVPIGLRLWLL